MSHLNLKQPLVFLDLETTGVNVATDRIVEIALLKVHPPTGEKRESRRYLLNPTIPIPEEASRVHKITDEDVKDMPTFKEVAKEIHAFIGGCDLAGYNSNKFDIPILLEEFERTDVRFDLLTRRLVDVQNIFHKMEQRTLSAAYKFYCNKDLEGAHTAEADTAATLDVLLAQLERYENLKNDVDFLAEFSMMHRHVDLAGRVIRNEKGEEIFNFGKHKGKPVREVFQKEPSYYDWMMNGDFTTNTKHVITQIRLKDFNKV